MKEKLINPKSWPADGASANFINISDHICDLIRQIYAVKKLNPESIHYKGLDIGEKDKTSALCAEELLTVSQLERIEENHGRDPLHSVISFALQVGIEQGRRIEATENKQKLGSTIKGLKMSSDWLQEHVLLLDKITSPQQTKGE